MFSSPVFLISSIVAFLALTAAIVFQILEMKAYLMF